MADHHHYHSGAPLPDEITKPFGIMIVTVITSFLTYKFLVFLEHWREFEKPYNLVGAFYYYSLTVPLNYAKYIWFRVAKFGFTGYPNINYVLGILAEFIYIALIFFILYQVAKMFEKVTHKPKKKLIFYFFVPALLALLWLLVTAVISWLLKTN